MSSKTSSKDGLNFEFCLDMVLDSEGGYSNDPQDPGGETKFGISKRAYPTVDIKNLTIEQAAAIYKRDYWDRILNIYPALNLIAFDCAVNQGVSFARSVYTEVQGLSPLSPQGQIEHFAKRREARYRTNPNFSRYGRGWLARLDEVKTVSLDSVT